MSPTLTHGSRIRVRCGDGGHAPGDVVVLADPPIAHRVIARVWRRARWYLITRGDASWFCDVPVSEDQILGVVTAWRTGDEWRALDPLPPARGTRAALAWLSFCSIWVALCLSDHMASLVARGGSAVAAWSASRG
jgi:hypothetical protein